MYDRFAIIICIKLLNILIYLINNYMWINEMLPLLIIGSHKSSVKVNVGGRYLIFD